MHGGEEFAQFTFLSSNNSFVGVNILMATTKSSKHNNMYSSKCELNGVDDVNYLNICENCLRLSLGVPLSHTHTLFIDGR